MSTCLDIFIDQPADSKKDTKKGPSPKFLAQSKLK